MTEYVIPQAVEMFGTPVIGSGERYVIELRELDEPLHFTNPKDMGTKYGDQYLKGDGTDILILNGVSKKQELMLNRYLYQYQKISGKDADHMSTQDVKKLLIWLEDNNFNDRYCSNLHHKETEYLHIRGRIFSKIGKPYKAVSLQKGVSYIDETKTQEASLDGALFIADGNGKGHITNIPEGYRTEKNGDNIISYTDAKKLYSSYLMQKNYTR